MSTKRPGCRLVNVDGVLVLVLTLGRYNEMTGTKSSQFCLLPFPRAGPAGWRLVGSLCASMLVPAMSLGVTVSFL